MAFSLGSLIGAMSMGRTQARRGQREQQQLDAEAERQNRLDLFNEYARSRQLAQTDNAQQNTIEREQMRLDAQRGIRSAENEAAAERARLNNEVAMWRNQAQFGKRGNEQEVGQFDRNNRSREGMNREDNLVRAQIEAAKAAARAANAQAGGITSQQKLTQVSQMRDDFQRDAPIASAQKLATVTNQLKAALAGESAMDDLSLVYETIKMFDPQTGVREGETTIFANSASLDERGRRLLLNWNKGRRLTASMRDDIRELVRRKELAAMALEKPVQARYGERLRRYGLEADSAFVAPSAFTNMTAPTPAAGIDPIAEALARRPKGKKP